MLLSYPSHHQWSKPVVENPLEVFGGSARRKIKNTVAHVAQNSVYTTIEPLTEKTLNWFIPMYEERIKQKQNPRIIDIMSATLQHSNKRTYYALSLFEADTPLGATIFSVSNDRLSIAYRTHAPRWLEANLPTSPSLYTEWVIADYACKQGIQKFVHGRNRNPYGKFSSIGLAIFKLSVGCVPKLSKHFEILTTDSTSFEEDVLVLLPPEGKSKYITTAYLIAEEKNLPLYEQVTKYPKRLHVEVLRRT